jgi:hypothetical protein
MRKKHPLNDPTEFVVFVATLARLASSKDDLTANEQRTVKDTSDKLIELGATFVGLVEQDEDKRRAELFKALFVGCLASSFTIGCLANPNRIVLRTLSNTRSATAARLTRSGIIDDLIVTAARPLWQKHPRRSAHWVAEQMIATLNTEFGKLSLPKMKVDTIRKRLEKCRAKIFSAR